MLTLASIKEATKEAVRSVLPLDIRKHLAVWLNHQRWISGNRRSWWCTELIRDLERLNINEYHKFLWANHLAYAVPYEVKLRFGHSNMKKSRKILFSDLQTHLTKISINPESDITSVFEVGCSSGYQLRYLESDLFPSAIDLAGIDIDRYAIESGSECLKSIGSKVRLTFADMEELSSLLRNKMYDIILCSGTLMYLSEESAFKVVNVMLGHTKIMLVLTGPAHPEIDNSLLEHSMVRNSDGSFIHNIDSMVKRAGGTVLARRWEGSKMVDGQTIYFVFAGEVQKRDQRDLNY